MSGLTGQSHQITVIASEAKQSHLKIPSKIPSKIRHCGNSVIAREQSKGSNLVQGLINEIASSFVSLTPRNDEFWGILKFHIEILGSSPRMTQGRMGDDIVGNLEFLRINLEFLEIASLRSQ